jgi:hypothetical protein
MLLDSPAAEFESEEGDVGCGCSVIGPVTDRFFYVPDGRVDLFDEDSVFLTYHDFFDVPNGFFDLPRFSDHHVLKPYY